MGTPEVRHRSQFKSAERWVDNRRMQPSMTHRGRLLCLATLVALAAAGCGGDTSTTSTAAAVDDGQPSTTQAAETTTTAPTTTVPETTTTAAPETTTTTAPATGLLEQPLAVGEVVQVSDWRIRVAAVTPEANDAVAAENRFNEPPEVGRQFFMAYLEGTYTGSESSDFWIDVSLKVVGPSNVAYESFDAYCGVIPDSIDDSGETFPGGSIAGNVCWSVDVADAQGLVMIAEPGFSFDDARAFLSLDPTATPIEASTSDGVDGSSRLGESVPIGQAAAVGPWTLTVVEVNPDATDVVLAENQFNEPPGEGEQFYIARIEGTYNGDESSTFWLDMSLKSIGDSSVAYEGFDGSCGVIPDDFDQAGETFPGGTIIGNVCWNVRSADVGSLVMIAEESFTPDQDRVFFSITPDG